MSSETMIDENQPTPDVHPVFETPSSAPIPFVDLANLDRRIVMSNFFHDGTRWRTWARVATGALVKLNIVELAEGFYFAEKPQSPTDAHFRFMDFIAQHASFPELKLAVAGVMDDISNLSASLAKLQLLHTSRDNVGSGITRMVATEVEYVLSVCRSLFDLLQEVINKLWQKVTLTGTANTKRPMKGSFAAVALFQEAPATAEKLVEKFGLPLPLVDFYVAVTPFFLQLRTIRDNLVHHGSQMQIIFSGDADFLISGHLRPFESMKIWRDQERQPNNLVPLRPAINSVVYRTLAVCEQFSEVMRQHFQLPPPVVPGMHLFMRGPFNSSFLDAMNDAVHREGSLNGEPQNRAPATTR
ncbi:hypothetical protein [Burkholderia seminalis]|uniref:hypothetical protein n=1 Tax=Burkholderia seminalis TaxID=488731 RepID=UPI000F5B1C3E|nr:hypothetical protein [Burkholderia seminalis]